MSARSSTVAQLKILWITQQSSALGLAQENCQPQEESLMWMEQKISQDDSPNFVPSGSTRETKIISKLSMSPRSAQTT